MINAAQISSVEAAVDFRVALCEFQEDANSGLQMIEQTAQRAMHWLEFEAPVYWKQQIRHYYDEVARTRTALETCRMRTVGGNRPACIEEQENYRAARLTLRRAEEQLDVLKHWTVRLRREVDEYRGRVMKLRLSLDYGVPRTIALLDRTLSSLEAYLGRNVTQPLVVDESGTTSVSKGSGPFSGNVGESKSERLQAGK